MEERSWATKFPGRQPQIAVKATSQGLSWTGFQAQVYDTLGGFAEMPPKTHHRVRMHLGAPINATCRCAGIVQRRRMTPGDLDVVPLAHSAVWRKKARARCWAFALCLRSYGP